MIIAIDFDGTVVDHRFPDIGPAVPHAVDSLRRLHQQGHRIILWTMRSGPYLQEAVKWYEQHEIPLYGINSNPDQHWSTSPKAYAELYIDDAAFGCPLIELAGFARRCVDWEKVMQVLAPKQVRRAAEWEAWVVVDEDDEDFALWYDGQRLEEGQPSPSAEGKSLDEVVRASLNRLQVTRYNALKLFEAEPPSGYSHAAYVRQHLAEILKEPTLGVDDCDDQPREEDDYLEYHFKFLRGNWDARCVIRRWKTWTTTDGV